MTPAFAPAILIAAAVASAQPVPLKRRPSADDKRAAETYVEEASAWITEYTERCRKIGLMVSDVVYGRAPNGEAVRAELSSLDEAFERNVRHFKTAPSPGLAAMTTFRRLYLDFLASQRKFCATRLPEALAIAEDARMTRDARTAKIFELVRPDQERESAAVDKLDAAKRTVLDALARR